MEIIDSRDDWEPNSHVGPEQPLVALCQQIVKEFDAACSRIENHVDAVCTRIEGEVEGLERQLRDLETEKWYARNVGAVGYRPEIRPREQVGGPWSKDVRYASPYRR